MQSAFFTIVCAVIASVAVMRDFESARFLFNLLRRSAYLIAGILIPLFFYWIWHKDEFWSAELLTLVGVYTVAVGVLFCARLLGPWVRYRT